ncbi:TonB-dependent receptor plug domain-containing protein, partial [uncultured Megasphaera sp.]
MRFQSNLKKQRMGLLLSCAVSLWLTAPLIGQQGVEAKTVSTHDVVVKATAAEEEAKFNSQQVSIITRKDIEQKQAKTVEDIIFTQTGVSRTVDSMGRVGVSIRGAEPRHT